MHISNSESVLAPTVILYGSCGEDNSWRTPLRQACDTFGQPYLDPYVSTGWRPDRLPSEILPLYAPEAGVVCDAVRADTSGFGSVAEKGWCIVSKLFMPKELCFYDEPVQPESNASKYFLRTRQLAFALGSKLQDVQPGLFTHTDNYEEFVALAIDKIAGLQQRKAVPSLVASTAARSRPLPEVMVSGSMRASGDQQPPTQAMILAGLHAQNITTYFPLKHHWNFERHHAVDEGHKFSAAVLIQSIDSHMQSYGSLVETSFMAAAALLLDRPFGVLIDDYIDPVIGEVNKNDYPNRLRAMTRQHLRIAADRSNGLIYEAENAKDLLAFASRAFKRSRVAA
jgi:hypothetical protein